MTRPRGACRDRSCLHAQDLTSSFPWSDEAYDSDKLDERLAAEYDIEMIAARIMVSQMLFRGTPALQY
jgi:hypothetical protein